MEACYVSKQVGTLANGVETSNTNMASEPRGLGISSVSLFRYLRFVPTSILTKRRAELGMAIFGIGALVTPLLLWVAWSPEVLRNVLIHGFFCMFVAAWFAQYAAPEKLEPGDDPMRPDPDEIHRMRESGRALRQGKRPTWREAS